MIGDPDKVPQQLSISSFLFIANSPYIFEVWFGTTCFVDAWTPGQLPLAPIWWATKDNARDCELTSECHHFRPRRVAKRTSACVDELNAAFRSGLNREA
jgi:hypothetical protein